MSCQQPTISVIFPTLNEARNLPLVFSHLPLKLIDEVILVDGRSTDNTIEVARRLLPSIKVVLEPTPGKGAAMRAGYRAARGDILFVVDADGSNDPREIPRFVQALLEGADFVKGSRFAPHGGTSDMPRIRQMGNGVFVKMVNLLFATSFTDLCYGYHAFWRYCLDSIDLEGVDGFEIDTALYLRALRDRLRITEVPSFEGYRFHGEGKLQTIPDGWRVLRTIATEWWAELRAPQKEAHLGFRGAVPAGAEPAGRRNFDRPAMNLSLDLDTNRTNLQLLQSACSLLGVQSSLRTMLEGVLQHTVASVDAASGSLMLMDEQGNVLEGLLAFDGEVQSLPYGGTQDTVRDGLAGWVVEHRQPALVTSTYDDPRWLNRAWESSISLSRSALGVPLLSDDRVVGVLTLVRPQAGQFSEHDLEALLNLSASAPAWITGPGNGSKQREAAYAGNGHNRYEALPWARSN